MRLTHGGRLAALVLIPVVLLLSGCLKMDTEIEITSMDKVSVRMLLAIEQTYASAIQEACADEGLEGVTVTPYDEEGFVGCVLEGEGPAAEVGATGQEMSVTEADGEYRFSMGGLGAGADLTEIGLEDAAMASAMFTTFRVAVTFPGEVTSSNGSSTVDGNTVTWTDPNDLMSGEGLVATGKAGPGLSTILLWTAVVAVAAAVVVGAVLLVRGRRSDRLAASQTSAYPAEQGYPAADGFPQGPPAYEQGDPEATFGYPVPGEGATPTDPAGGSAVGPEGPQSGPDFRPPSGTA